MLRPLLEPDRVRRPDPTRPVPQAACAPVLAARVLAEVASHGYSRFLPWSADIRNLLSASAHGRAASERAVRLVPPRRSDNDSKCCKTRAGSGSLRPAAAYRVGFPARFAPVLGRRGSCASVR